MEKNKIMKKILLILLCLPMIGFGQNVNIPDANFKACLVGEPLINTNGDTEIQVSEANAYSGYIFCYSQNISNLIGIEAFTALTSLYCGNNQLTSIDVSNNLALNILQCGNNQLTSLDVSQNTSLIELRFSNNQLTSIDVSANTALTYLSCHNNQLTSLDVSSNTILTDLICYDNQLTSLDLSQNTILTDLTCNNNQLTSLDVSQNTALTELSCWNNQLTSIDVSNNLALNALYCNDNLITNLDISSNTSLWNLLCYGNQLINLNVKNGNNFNWLESFEGIPFVCTNNPSLTCIEVDDVAFSDTNWTVANGYIDPQHYFSNNCSGTAIEEYSTTKEVLKVTDLLGRETKGTKNEVLFYIYDDGTVEKRIVIE
jgi:Leucine-rich repeat (LRR) protein